MTSHSFRGGQETGRSLAGNFQLRVSHEVAARVVAGATVA